MSLNPWPLICFTLFIQMSVGCFIISEFACLALSRRFNVEGLRFLRLLIRSLVLVISFLAVALSFFHIGNPWRALNILNNLGSSGLSQEITFLLIFILLVAVSLILEWRKVMGQNIQRIFFLLGGLSGLFVVVAMFRLYMLPTVPAWNHFSTPVVFILVCFLLGSQLMAVTWTFFLKKSKDPFLQEICSNWNEATLSKVRRFSFVMAVLLLAVVIFLFFQSGPFSRLDDPAQRPQFHKDSVLWILRILLLLWGVFWIGRKGLPLRPFSVKKSTDHRRFYFIFILFFLAEILGRYLFFMAYFRLGL